MLNPIIKTTLSNKDYQRYAKQIIINNINVQGQYRLRTSRVLCVGAGGLNSPNLLYLASCGVGVLGIIDKDNIELSNLQRQIIYRTYDLGKSKARVAFNTLKNLNPNITINIHDYYLTKNNLTQILSEYDIVIDGTDNFKTRYLISQYCYYLHKIHIYGAIEQFTGQISVFNYQSGLHYYNMHSNISNISLKNCNHTGLMNTIAGVTGILQTTEAIKIILGIGAIINKRLLIYNTIYNSFKQIKVKKKKIKERIITQPSQEGTKEYISLDSLKGYYDPLFLDVRTSLEFQHSNIQKSINIPLNLLKQPKYVAYLKTMQSYDIILYCNDEKRSYIASQILQNNHIKHYILKGGLHLNRKERDSNPR